MTLLKFEWFFDESYRTQLIDLLIELSPDGIEETKNSLIVYLDVEKAATFPRLIFNQPAFLGLILNQNEPKIFVRISPVPEIDWTESYKMHFKITKITQRFYLKPPWIEVSTTTNDRVFIEILPGQAFGTGLHASTQMALKMLERASWQVQIHAHRNLLDVGTGSGILAIAGEHLGFKKIVALDTDPMALENARINLKNNQMSQIELIEGDLDSIKSTFLVVIANITWDTHERLALEYARICQKGGYLILSGLLESQRSLAQELFQSLGFITQETCCLQDWSSLMLYRTLDGSKT